MDTESKIFSFYILIILCMTIVTFLFSGKENRMHYSMQSAILGALVSQVLWINYGSEIVKADGSS
jgi:uncharacterized membrane protein